MKPSSILLTVKKQLKLFTKQENASEYYAQQKEAINEIKNTAGFHEIRNYWIRFYDESASKLEKQDEENLVKVASLRADMRNARGFLSYLDNLMD